MADLSLRDLSRNIEDRRDWTLRDNIAYGLRNLPAMLGYGATNIGQMIGDRLFGLTPEEARKEMAAISRDFTRADKGDLRRMMPDNPNPAIGPVPPSALGWRMPLDQYLPYAFVGYPHLDYEDTHNAYTSWPERVNIEAK